MTKPYEIRGWARVPEADAEAFARELPNHIAATRAEPGCRHFSVIPRETEPRTYDVHEIFDDEAAFRVHQARVATTPWVECTRNLERHYDLVEQHVR